MSNTPPPSRTHDLYPTANPLPPEFSRIFNSHSLDGHPPTFTILQLNCHNRKDTTLSVLSSKSSSLAILLQDPWNNPVDHLPPTHLGWQRVTLVDRPGNSSERMQCCIYIKNSTLTYNFHRLLRNSKFLMAVNSQATVLAWETLLQTNPHYPYDGLKSTSPKVESPKIPPHSPSLQRPHQTLRTEGFHLDSPTGVPTFQGARVTQTTIDLCWTNVRCRKSFRRCTVALDNHASDHQPIHLELSIGGSFVHPMPIRGISFDKVNTAHLQNDVPTLLGTFPVPKATLSTNKIDLMVKRLTAGIQQCHLKQGAAKWRGSARSKNWWDPSILGHLVASCNRAQRWMLLDNSVDARDCYLAWQAAFKNKVEELKLLHWQCFLAKTGESSAFQAYKFTKAKQTLTVEPLYQSDCSLTTDVEQQARILFNGTFVIETTCDLTDVPPWAPESPLLLPPVTTAKVEQAI
ncbi:hypothetical protein PCANC_27696 [Puccinia coronata f. sp. avenae]|uniref:Endonuclease/exonuclease/phosphatase domain-containing protein n=1 Tax=Puccinia coronata f. sp. avenae TaxID=200324 RepID=A0A2N5RYJ4_9BASI|nr:hypothetical protein PCANC_27696 [Puccinia coronata f. sp. avenae]